MLSWSCAYKTYGHRKKGQVDRRTDRLDDNYIPPQGVYWKGPKQGSMFREIFWQMNVTWKNWISCVMKMLFVWESLSVSIPSRPNTRLRLSFNGITMNDPSRSWKWTTKKVNKTDTVITIETCDGCRKEELNNIEILKCLNQEAMVIWSKAAVWN